MKPIALIPVRQRTPAVNNVAFSVRSGKRQTSSSDWTLRFFTEDVELDIFGLEVSATYQALDSAAMDVIAWSKKHPWLALFSAVGIVGVAYGGYRWHQATKEKAEPVLLPSHRRRLHGINGLAIDSLLP